MRFFFFLNVHLICIIFQTIGSILEKLNKRAKFTIGGKSAWRTEYRDEQKGRWKYAFVTEFSFAYNDKYVYTLFLFYFLLPIGVEKDKLSNLKFGWKNTFWDFIIIITQKQIIPVTPYFVICNSIICATWNKFDTLEKKICAQGYSKEFEHISDYEQTFLLMHFNVFRLQPPPPSHKIVFT